MKMLISLALAVGALAGPAVSFAQTSTAPVTRAQVYADLVRIEQAGYRPGTANDVHYPEDIQAAEAKVAAQSNPANDAAGGISQSGTSGSGSPASVTATHSVYFGH